MELGREMAKDGIGDKCQNIACIYEWWLLEKKEEERMKEIKRMITALNNPLSVLDDDMIRHTLT